MDLYTGRKRIVIPVTVEQFNENPIGWIKRYLHTCLATNKANEQEYKKLYAYYCGDHDIKNKTRINGSNDNNNQTIVNHIFRHIEFKKGFMVGNPIEYSNANSKLETDDMTYLNKYFRDSKKASLDISKYEQIYIGGVANTFIIPRRSDFDVKNEAPFTLSVLEQGQGFVVYSSDITKEPLFNVTISEHVELDVNRATNKMIYDIYYVKKEDGYCYTFSLIRNGASSFGYYGEGVETKQTYKFLPITEFALNDSRMGIVETIISLQDFINTTKSNQIDGIVDFINSYLVFENQNFKSPDFLSIFEELKKKRVLGLSTVDPSKPAKVSLLKDELQNQDIELVYESTKSEMYDINAVPISSGNVTSGGDTGQARLLGNGWESAQNQAGTDTTYLTQFEYDLLSKIVWICKDAVGSPIKEISPSDIEIKYSINMSNNLLVKAQALKNLYDINMPKEDALIMTGITSDTHGVGHKWQLNDDKKIQMENQTQQNTQTNSNSNID